MMKFLATLIWFIALGVVFFLSLFVFFLDFIIDFFADLSGACYHYSETGEWEWPNYKDGL